MGLEITVPWTRRVLPLLDGLLEYRYLAVLSHELSANKLAPMMSLWTGSVKETSQTLSLALPNCRQMARFFVSPAAPMVVQCSFDQLNPPSSDHRNIA